MTSTLQFIFANLLRRKLRTMVTVAGIAIAVAAVFSLISFQRSYADGLRSDLDRLGAHLIVVPKGCPYDLASLALHGASWPCYLKSAYLETVMHTPHVAVAAPVLMSAVYVATTGEQVVYCGVLPNILQLKRLWRIQGAMFQSPGEILVGSEMAQNQHWSIGQTVSLPGLKNMQAKVAGILKPTDGADDLFIYMPLLDAQKAFNRPNQLTHILVRLDDPEAMDEAVDNLRGCDAGLEMNVVPLAHLFNTIQGLIESTRLLLYCVAFVAVLAAGAGLSNTILMAVSERTREIGVLRAIGGSRLDIFRLVWGETITMCLFGSVIGILGSMLSATAVDSWLRQTLPFAPQGPLIRFDSDLALFCAVGAVVVGTFASLLPAGRASRLSPALAIRAVGADI